MDTITINEVRLSYCNVLKPSARPGQDAKYSATLLIPKTNAAAKAALGRGINDAIEKGTSSKWNGQRPPRVDICLHDGDGPRPGDGAPYGPECRGMWVITASANVDHKPFVVDGSLNPIIDPRAMYSGVWANVCISFYAYNSNGKKGIGCGLIGVQKIRDDEPLGSTVTAESVFSAIPAAAPATPATPAYSPAAYGYAPSVPGAPDYGYAQPASPGSGPVDPITGLPVW